MNPPRETTIAMEKPSDTQRSLQGNVNEIVEFSKSNKKMEKFQFNHYQIIYGSKLETNMAKLKLIFGLTRPNFWVELGQAIRVQIRSSFNNMDQNLDSTQTPGDFYLIIPK